MISQDAPSVALSQGNGTTVGPGEDSAAAGAMGFYDAVTLASQQPLDPNKDARPGSATSTSSSARPGAPPATPPPRPRARSHRRVCTA